MMVERMKISAIRYLGFSIEVPDIMRFYAERTARGVNFTSPPQKQPWGGTMTHIADCDRNTFSIVQREDTG